MGKIFVMDHPLIQHKLSLIRDKNTGSKEFRELVNEVAMLMAYEATRDLPLTEAEVETPICPCKTKVLAGKKIGVVPILRAGLGMLDGVLRLIPAARVGHIGLYRDPETLEPVEYYCKLPGDITERDLIVLDPMLATGGSASAAISFIKNRGCKSIRMMNLIAAPEGIERVRRDHPDVDVYVACVDEKLNDHGYIVPGLGDAGDRLFGTQYSPIGRAGGESFSPRRAIFAEQGGILIEIKRKTLRRAEWWGGWEMRFAWGGFAGFGVQGVAALLRVDRVQVPLMDGDRMLCGAGYDWLQLAPQGERWWCTAFFRPDGQLEQLYFDITRGNALNGPDSHFEDLFLDVVAEPDGRVFRLDEAELRAAVDAGLVSSAEAARARADADALEVRLRAGFPALCALLGRVRAERIPELARL